MALRIEDNVDGTLENVNQAQAQLLKYLNTISSNRWLILKVRSRTYGCRITLNIGPFLPVAEWMAYLGASAGLC